MAAVGPTAAGEAKHLYHNRWNARARRCTPEACSVPADHGPCPYVVNIQQATIDNCMFRTALWTGTHLQVTLMSIPVGGDIGQEIHPETDQFLRIEQGHALVQMGTGANCLTYRRCAGEEDAIFVPAGTWHNVTNTGTVPLKLYSIYAPPKHPFGTVHPTKADAEAAEAAEAAHC